ncbi:hypothetical protein D3C75_1191210 [compost metagenome]
MVELADLDSRAAQAATFGGLGVGIFEVLEAGRVAWRFAVDREGVTGGCQYGMGPGQGQTNSDKKGGKTGLQAPDYLYPRLWL